MKTKRAKTADLRARVRAADRATVPAGHPQVPGDFSDERHRMATCCAFFKAERYREAGPGRIRTDDVDVAEAQIESIIRKCRVE